MPAGPHLRQVHDRIDQVRTPAGARWPGAACSEVRAVPSGPAAVVTSAAATIRSPSLISTWRGVSGVVIRAAPGGAGLRPAALLPQVANRPARCAPRRNRPKPLNRSGSRRAGAPGVRVSGMTGDEPGRRVAWVTGGSRGVGRGVAAALGQAGWVVYVTARSSAAGRTGHLPGTVEETAEAVTAAGGLGVPVPCDHRDDEAVRAVAGRIRSDHGRLDLLVNNAWGGYERLNAGGWRSGPRHSGSSRSSCSTRCSAAGCGPTTWRPRCAPRCSSRPRTAWW